MITLPNTTDGEHYIMFPLTQLTEIITLKHKYSHYYMGVHPAYCSAQ